MIENQRSPLASLPNNVRGKILSFISTPNEQIVFICGQSLGGKFSLETNDDFIKAVEAIRKEIFGFYITECFHNYFNTFLKNLITRSLFSRILEKMRHDVNEIWEKFYEAKKVFESKETESTLARKKYELTREAYWNYQKQSIEILYKPILLTRELSQPKKREDIKIYSPNELQTLIPFNIGAMPPHLFMNASLIKAIDKQDSALVKKIISILPNEIAYLQAGYNALQIAVNKKMWQVVEIILVSPVSKIIPGFEQTLLAVQTNKPELLHALLHQNAFQNLFNLNNFEHIVILFLNAHFSFFEEDLKRFQRERNPRRFFGENDIATIRFEKYGIAQYFPSKEVMIAFFQSALILALREKNPHLVKPFLFPHLKSIRRFMTHELKKEISKTFGNSLDKFSLEIIEFLKKWL